MNRTSPPKPWERPGSSNPIRPAITSSSAVSNTNITPSPSSISSLTTTTNNTPRPPLRPWERGRTDDYRSGYGSNGNYGNSYGGYGSSGSGYGGSGSGYGGIGSGYGGIGSYGRDRDYGGYNSYGRSYGEYGSGYGGSYGSGYGGSGSYGSGYGGYGSGNNGYGRGDYDNKALRGSSFVSNVQYFVDSFSRFSRLLDANYDAMHGSFASIIRLLDHMGRLNFEVMTVLKTFALFRILQSVISRIFGVFKFLLPWRSSSPSTSSPLPSNSKDKNLLSIRDFQNFANSSTSTTASLSSSPTHSQPSWRTLLVVFLVTFVGLPVMAGKMFSALSARRNALEAEWGKEGGEREQVVALHDFTGESERELSFYKGDTLTIVNKFHQDWWEAELNGHVGVIPANYVSQFTPGGDGGGDSQDTPS